MRCILRVSQVGGSACEYVVHVCMVGCMCLYRHMRQRNIRAGLVSAKEESAWLHQCKSAHQ